MSGSFTFNAIVRIGQVHNYDKATVITVMHEYGKTDDSGSHKILPVWNKVVCFNPTMRDRIKRKISTGDLVHFTGTVRNSSFKDANDEKHFTVDLVISGFDVLQKYVLGVEDTRLVDN